jgi:acyl carrier protein
MKISRDELLGIILDSGVEREVVDALEPGIHLGSQGIDSVDHAAILMTMQDTLGITVSDEEAPTLVTLEDFEALIRNR